MAWRDYPEKRKPACKVPRTQGSFRPYLDFSPGGLVCWPNEICPHRCPGTTMLCAYRRREASYDRISECQFCDTNVAKASTLQKGPPVPQPLFGQLPSPLPDNGIATGTAANRLCVRQICVRFFCAAVAAMGHRRQKVYGPLALSRC